MKIINEDLAIRPASIKQALAIEYGGPPRKPKKPRVPQKPQAKRRPQKARDTQTTSTMVPIIKRSFSLPYLGRSREALRELRVCMGFRTQTLHEAHTLICLCQWSLQDQKECKLARALVERRTFKIRRCIFVLRSKNSERVGSTLNKL